MRRFQFWHVLMIMVLAGCMHKKNSSTSEVKEPAAAKSESLNVAVQTECVEETPGVTPECAPKNCCFCYYSRAECASQGTVSACRDVPDCTWQDNRCISVLQIACNSWAQQQQGCSTMSIFEEESPTMCDGEILPGIPEWQPPTGCNTVRVQRFGHSTPILGCREMRQIVTVCLDRNPECTDLTFADGGCSTFANPFLAENYVRDLAAQHPGITMTMTGFQNDTYFDHCGVCLTTSRQTFTVNCNGGVTTSYESCDTSTSRMCLAGLKGDSKICTAADGSLKVVKCCLKDGNWRYRDDCP